jgi:hypothetical protein
MQPNLHAVADTEHWKSQGEDRLVKGRRLWREHRVRAPRDDNPSILGSVKGCRWRAQWLKLGLNLELAYDAVDELNGREVERTRGREVRIEPLLFFSFSALAQ